MFSESQIQKIEQTINYSFSNKALIFQAFTRRSYTTINHDWQNNEVLEFYGDKVLSFILGKSFAQEFGSLKTTPAESNQFFSSENEGILTTRYIKLTNNDFLSQKMEESGLLEFVQKSKQETLPAKYGADIFESLLGAVAIDSNWNIQYLKQVVDSILNPNSTFAEKSYSQNNFQERLIQLCQQTNMTMSAIEIFKTSDGFSAHLTITGTDYNHTFKQRGKTKKGAVLGLCRTAYIHIKLIYQLQPVEDWIINPVAQVKKLYDEGIIKSYSFEHTSIVNHKKHKKIPAWNCTCSIISDYGNFQTTSDQYNSKKTGQYKSALALIPQVLSAYKRHSLKGKGLLKVIMGAYL